MKRLRVILFVKNYLPGYKSGGPLRTIINMIESMSNEIEFLVVTSDRDLGDREPYRNVRIDQWNTVGKVQVFYASRANQSRTRLAKIVNETPHHLLYFNSLYDPIFTIPLLIARRLGALGVAPILIAPRGECLPSASKLKAWKKIPYLWMSKIFGLYTGVCWHASTDLESASIAATLGMKSAESRKRIFTALNLCCVSQLKAPESVPARSNGQPLRICFLSRICKMKNLDFALDVIARCRVPVQFNIYGPLEDEEYWEMCKRKIAKIPVPIEVNRMGSVLPEDVTEVFQRHDLFLLPSRGENFGHVIAEALLAGTPVLISDMTPWHHLERDGVGWDLPLGDTGAFVTAIEEASKIGELQYNVWRQRVRAYGVSNAINPDHVQANLQMMLDVSQKNVQYQKRITNEVLLIDAGNINEGGGFVLLDYLVKKLDERNVDYVLLKRSYCPLKSNSAKIINNDGNFLVRQLKIRGWIRKCKPKTLLCFGNFPVLFPSNKTDVLCYIHNQYLFEETNDWHFWLRRMIMKLLLRNAHGFIFQTNLNKDKFHAFYPSCAKRSFVFPFFDLSNLEAKRSQFEGSHAEKKCQFSYISLPIVHKQHPVLLDAWEALFAKGISIPLQVTIPENCPALFERVTKMQAKGIPILNLGKVNLETAIAKTFESKYCIFPSTMETLGLGMLEATLLGRILLTTDLPFVTEVVKPSLTFKAENAAAIVEAVEYALANDLPKPSIVITNKIDELIDTLVKKS